MKGILVVEDINMKRIDSWIDFHYLFLKKCNFNNIHIEFILPVEPCKEVKEMLEQTNFKYSIFNKWWVDSKTEKRHNFKLAFYVFRCILEKKDKIDIVAFHFINESTVLLLWLLLKICRIKVKLVWHQHSEIISLRKGFSIKKYLSKIRIVSLVCEKICTVYHGQKQILEERLISSKKITTIYNGIDLSKYNNHINKSELKGKLIGNVGPVILTIGSLIPRKGINFLLMALPHILKVYPQAVLLIVGEGPLDSNLKTLARNLSVDDKVVFLGRRNDVNQIISLSDVFVLPSLAEPFGIVNIEAMAMAKPVIATKVGGIPEIIKDKESGILVPPADSIALANTILEVLRDQTKAIAMGKRAREIVEEKFTIDKMVDNYFSLYQSLNQH
ncbi:MAG: glycosyltransferase family 4 protein [Candidatus Omnitrophica bacterium]|nr:glycosyltransferase family 4 protein [Candidatus Omnitrophota bacterium]